MKVLVNESHDKAGHSLVETLDGAQHLDVSARGCHKVDHDTGA